MNLLQLEPSIPLLTPRGRGRAVVLIDYGIEEHLLWVVFLDDTGECWTFPNKEVRAEPNLTMGAKRASPIKQ
jgi:hypothetical protein